MKWMTKYKGAMARYYNKKLKVRRFNTNDLFLRKVSQAIKDPSQVKLGPSWEGPYKVTRHSWQGPYHLKTLDNKELPHPWNIEHLKKYYQYEILSIPKFLSLSECIFIFTVSYMKKCFYLSINKAWGVVLFRSHFCRYSYYKIINYTIINTWHQT